MKKGKIWAIVLLIISLLVLIGFLIYPVVIIVESFYFTQSSASMGIIGGADGPTAILVSSNLFSNCIFNLVMSALGLVSFIVSIVYFVKNRKNKNQE